MSYKTLRKRQNECKDIDTLNTILEDALMELKQAENQLSSIFKEPTKIINKLKAFEFIKPYINVYAPNRRVDRDKYMLCVGHDAYEIPKEIYDLFKKVLL